MNKIEDLVYAFLNLHNNKKIIIDFDCDSITSCYTEYQNTIYIVYNKKETLIISFIDMKRQNTNILYLLLTLIENIKTNLEIVLEKELLK
jgi:hypothetical protein